LRDVVNVAKHHWLPCFLGFGLLFFMAVEYTLRMVPSSSPPFDLGFVVTRRLHGLLSSWPELNTSLAGLNTVCMSSIMNNTCINEWAMVDFELLLILFLRFDV
jgi:hypothetical protein